MRCRICLIFICLYPVIVNFSSFYLLWVNANNLWFPNSHLFQVRIILNKVFASKKEYVGLNAQIKDYDLFIFLFIRMVLVIWNGNQNIMSKIESFSWIISLLGGMDKLIFANWDSALFPYTAISKEQYVPD